MARILVCVTGSVAAIKTTELLERLGGRGYEIRVALTHAADFFLPEWQQVRASDRIGFYRDADEWPKSGWKRGDEVLHIELRRWADTMLIAPLDAHTLAKWATGLADNLVSSIIRAWDFSKPLLFAPAMNTMMWQNPVTRRHLSQILADLDEKWPDSQNLATLEALIDQFSRHPKPVRMIAPVEKTLACGDTGVGAMASMDEILSVVQTFVEPNLAMD
ncbi:MAG: flavoprotein [Isosphaeraceae bacterium]